MYKAAVRWMIRRNIASVNAGDYRPALAMFSDDLEFSFPGETRGPMSSGHCSAAARST